MKGHIANLVAKFRMFLYKHLPGAGCTKPIAFISHTCLSFQCWSRSPLTMLLLRGCVTLAAGQWRVNKFQVKLNTEYRCVCALSGSVIKKCFISMICLAPFPLTTVKYARGGVAIFLMMEARNLTILRYTKRFPAPLSGPRSQGDRNVVQGQQGRVPALGQRRLEWYLI